MVPSLSLLFHLADTAQGDPVSHSALLRACAGAQYLETHARRIFAPALDPEMVAAVALDRRLLSLSEPFTAKDVYRKPWRLLDNRGTAGAISILVDYGRIRGEVSSGSGRPTRHRLTGGDRN